MEVSFVFRDSCNNLEQYKIQAEGPGIARGKKLNKKSVIFWPMLTPGYA